MQAYSKVHRGKIETKIFPITTCYEALAIYSKAFACLKTRKKTQKQCVNMFKVNHKGRRRTSTLFCCPYCELQKDPAHCFGVSILDFEQVNLGWVFIKKNFLTKTFLQIRS